MAGKTDQFQRQRRWNNRFNLPFGIFAEPAGQIYMADTGNHRIIRLDDMAGKNWTAFGTHGTGTNQFEFPRGIFLRRF
jgi:hypothetical protein